MRHTLATLLHRAADRLDHAHTVTTQVHDHDHARTVTVHDHHTRLRATYDPTTA